jgi:two-component system response regulator AtoC
VTAIPVELGVRVALRDRDAGRAARYLAAAGDRRAPGDPVRAGTLFALAILVQGALGDAGTAARELSEGLRLLRRRHAPVAAQELRIAHIEALVEAGERALASERLRRLLGRRSPILSGLSRSRLDEIAARLRRLEEHPSADVEAGASQVDTGAVVRILQRCHEADDDRAAVAGVCQAVRSALAAASVSAFHVISGAATLAATDGGRSCRAETAERAAVALLAIGPEASPAGHEAAAPVRYGGEAVGAVTARWTADAVLDAARAQGVLAAAAAAIGPAMAALARQDASSIRDSGVDGELSGISDAMAALRREVTRAAAAPFPVLVQGESGTGKELIARAVHAGSARRHRRFCAVNCAALSDDLFETELFGHARGAFTGAAADRRGLFEEADGGTLFLDEVGELSPRAQAKLLRAIQEGEIRRVGENHPRRVDARIVAATNRLLGDEVRAGRFRHDLLFRLDVVRIVVPPLRERPEDIAPLALSLWRDATLRIGGRAELAPATLAALARYDWPGNVRELQNTLAALAVHAPARGRVGPSSLPAAIVGSATASRSEMMTLVLARRRFEERFVRATLARTGGRRSEAAAALGLTRQGLAKLMARLGIETAAREQATY